jgi:hypothetical protein
VLAAVNLGTDPVPGDLSRVELDGSGYRWLRLSRTIGP